MPLRGVPLQDAEGGHAVSGRVGQRARLPPDVERLCAADLKDVAQLRFRTPERKIGSVHLQLVIGLEPMAGQKGLRDPDELCSGLCDCVALLKEAAEAHRRSGQIPGPQAALVYASGKKAATSFTSTSSTASLPSPGPMCCPPLRARMSQVSRSGPPSRSPLMGPGRTRVSLALPNAGDDVRFQLC